MASNLNKAFMRAYAKDRSAPAEAAPVAPVVAAPQPPAPQASFAPAPKLASVNAPTPTSRVPSVAQPSMEPSVFAGRYVPSTTAPSTNAPSTTTPSAAAPRADARPQAASSINKPITTSTASNTHRIPAPSVVSGTKRPVASPQPSRQINSDEATQVWQRIDAAHVAPVPHAAPTEARPTVSVGAARPTAPQRMQAAAPARAPAAPAAKMRIDAPEPNSTRPLPLMGDDVSDAQPADTRRRTVADFLYAAGQYNPGRVLASADNADVAMAPAASATTLRGSEMVRSSEPTYEPTYERSPVNHSTVANAPLNHSPVSHSTAPSHGFASPAIEQPRTSEPMPRRVGQILRVDVPRGHAAAAQPMQQPVQQPAPAQGMPQHTSQPSTPSGSMATSSISASAAPALDAPVAKYVLEQRRIDRAHKLNEAEDKLRRNTHKIFNPVWEVDNLQWPVVVNKLMQQRAQSMSHVAEHLKTACQDGLSVLGVTSADGGEGRTTVACCLARLAAAHGLNVALVDIDLDHPTLCVQTNMEVEYDWRDCFSEDVSLEEVAVHSIEDQLTVLPLKPRGNRPGLLASDSRIANILKDLSESFELIIVDCAKTNSSGNVITGLAHTKIFDAAIVVVDRRDSQADRIEDSVRMIQQTGIESIGIVDNFSM